MPSIPIATNNPPAPPYKPLTDAEKAHQIVGGFDPLRKVLHRRLPMALNHAERVARSTMRRF